MDLYLVGQTYLYQVALVHQQPVKLCQLVRRLGCHEYPHLLPVQQLHDYRHLQRWPLHQLRIDFANCHDTLYYVFEFETRARLRQLWILQNLRNPVYLVLPYHPVEHQNV